MLILTKYQGLRVIQQLEGFCSKPFEYQKQLIDEHQHIIKHNFKVATTFPHKKILLDVMEKFNE